MTASTAMHKKIPSWGGDRIALTGGKVTTMTQNSISSFSFGVNPVRVVTVDGESWWVASDVCSILGLSNPTVTLDRLDEDERSKFNLGRQGDASIVNESGLYSLILGSRKKEAKIFKKWITSEVLPQIRKTGMYAVPSIANDPEALAQAIVSAMGAKSTWEQPLAEKIEQSRSCAKGTYEVMKNKVLPALERLEAHAPAVLGEMKPREVIQMLNAISRASSNPRSYEAAKRLYPNLFPSDGGIQPLLPGMVA